MTERPISHDELRYALLDHMEEAEADALLATLDTNLTSLMAATTTRVVGQLTEFIGSWHIEQVNAERDDVTMALWRLDYWDRHKIHTRRYRIPHAALWGDTSMSALRKEQDDAIDAEERQARDREQAKQRAEIEAQERAQFLRLKAKFEPGGGA